MLRRLLPLFTGTVVGQLDTGERQAAVAERPAEPAPGRMLQVLPAVRALARKLDVDLNAVQATGPGGTITRADVERAAKSLAEAGSAEALRGMRRAMAQRMAAAHAEVVPALSSTKPISTNGERAKTQVSA